MSTLNIPLFYKRSKRTNFHGSKDGRGIVVRLICISKRDEPNYARIEYNVQCSTKLWPESRTFVFVLMLYKIDMKYLPWDRQTDRQTDRDLHVQYCERDTNTCFMK